MDYNITLAQRGIGKGTSYYLKATHDEESLDSESFKTIKDLRIITIITDFKLLLNILSTTRKRQPSPDQDDDD